MNKKFILPITFIVLVNLMFFVSAELRWAGGQYGVSDSETDSYSVHLIKGWNLVQGLADPSFINAGPLGGEVSKNSIKAIFVLNPVNKEYYQVYPNPEKSKLDNLGPMILQTPFWVYSSEDLGDVSYSTKKLTDNFKITWPAGWNFISISNEMAGKSLNEIKGNCNIEKAYFWTDKSNPSGSWVDILNSNEKFNVRDLFRLGIALKFTSECKLGLNSDSGQVTSPPAIPSGNSGDCTDSDGGTVSDVRGTTSANGETKQDNCASDLNLIEYDCDNNAIRQNTFDCSQVGMSRCDQGRCV